MKLITYYAIKGMIASEATAIETLTKRISILAGRHPQICNLMIEGVAVSVHVKNTARLCKLLNVKTVETLKCSIETCGDLCQEVYVEYDCEGKHHCNAYPLPFNMEKLEDIFDVEYVQPLVRAGGVGYQLTSSSLFQCVTKQNALINRRASPGCYSALLPVVARHRISLCLCL